MSDLRVLTVCTHNRTRSVLIGALLGEHLAERGTTAEIATAGIRDEGQPPTEETVRLLAARGHDVRSHRSRRVSADLVASADLVVTAERDHVVWIAGSFRGTFARTFTLPELLRWAAPAGPRQGDPWDQWLACVNAERPRASDYLAARIDEIDDPTGRATKVWEQAFSEIDTMCAQLAALIA